MNYQVFTYVTYILVIIILIVFVGQYFFKNGRIFIISLLKGNVSLADQLNRLLLFAYCLFNIGYAFLKIKNWEKVGNLEQVLSSLTENIGLLVLILAITHYLNMLAIYILSKSNSITIKSYLS